MKAAAPTAKPQGEGGKGEGPGEREAGGGGGDGATVWRQLMQLGRGMGLGKLCGVAQGTAWVAAESGNRVPCSTVGGGRGAPEE